MQVWLNSVLAPVKAGELAHEQALAGRRLTARVRGLLWRLYSQDAGLVATMMRVEARIESGQFRLKEEARPPLNPPPTVPHMLSQTWGWVLPGLAWHHRSEAHGSSVDFSCTSPS